MPRCDKNNLQREKTETTIWICGCIPKGEERLYVICNLAMFKPNEDNVSLCIQDPLAHMADMLAIDNLSSGQPFLAKVCIGYYKIVLL